VHTYYLDSNALSFCCFGHLGGWTKTGAAALQQALSSSLKSDAISILGSHFHIEEASRIPSQADRRQFFEMFWSLVGWLLLEPTSTLVKLEAQNGGPLTGYDAFESVVNRQLIKRYCQNDAKLAELATDVKAYVDKNVADLRTRKATVEARLQAQFTGMTPAQITAEWWKSAPSQIDDWVKDYIANSKAFLELPDDQSSWPTPQSQQTARAIHGYSMARVYMNVGLNRKIGDGDPHDAHHYGAACYAQTFVSHDKALRDTIAEIPNQPLEVLDFNQFAQRMGVQPH
jgi:hypothetical protein